MKLMTITFVPATIIFFSGGAVALGAANCQQVSKQISTRYITNGKKEPNGSALQPIADALKGTQKMESMATSNGVNAALLGGSSVSAASQAQRVTTKGAKEANKKFCEHLSKARQESSNALTGLKTAGCQIGNLQQQVDANFDRYEKERKQRCGSDSATSETSLSQEEIDAMRSMNKPSAVSTDVSTSESLSREDVKAIKGMNNPSAVSTDIKTSGQEEILDHFSQKEIDSLKPPSKTISTDPSISNALDHDSIEYLKRQQNLHKAISTDTKVSP